MLADVVQLVRSLPPADLRDLWQLLSSNGSSATFSAAQVPMPYSSAALPLPLASPGSGSVCSSASLFSCPPAPPPPPPPLSIIVRPQLPLPNPPQLSTTSRGPTPAAEIPRALRPKALPEQGRRLRHLQWAKLPTNVVATAAASTSSGNRDGKDRNVWQNMDAVDREMSEREG